MSPSGFAAAFAVAGGVGVAFQASVNSILGQRIGVIETALLSGVVTSVLLVAAMVVVRRGGGGLGGLAHAPAWLWLGGIGGTIAVSAVSYAPARIGVFATLVVFLGGQLVAAFLIDSLGLLGAERSSVTVARVAGLILVATGSLLVLRR